MKTITFGFYTKDLTILNEDFQKCNGGNLPSPSQIKKVSITEAEDTYELHVHVVLFA